MLYSQGMLNESLQTFGVFACNRPMQRSPAIGISIKQVKSKLCKGDKLFICTLASSEKLTLLKISMLSFFRKKRHSEQQCALYCLSVKVKASNVANFMHQYFILLLSWLHSAGATLKLVWNLPTLHTSMECIHFHPVD